MLYQINTCITFCSTSRFSDVQVQLFDGPDVENGRVEVPMPSQYVTISENFVTNHVAK